MSVYAVTVAARASRFKAVFHVRAALPSTAVFSALSVAGLNPGGDYSILVENIGGEPKGAPRVETISIAC